MGLQENIKHPAVYTDKFIPIFAEHLQGYNKVYDPFAGTGKISLIREFGWSGDLYCSEIEPEWTHRYSGINHWFIGDSSKTSFIKDGFFDAICTSPTYGNRMADHFEARDSSKRITYRHRLGRVLSEDNTGRMQWGEKYKNKHQEIYTEVLRTLRSGGLFILNISDHIRAGRVIPVSQWHVALLINLGCIVEKEINIETQRMGFGANAKARVDTELICILRKG